MNKNYKPERFGLGLPMNKGYCVCYRDKNGKQVPTDLYFKSKRKAQEVADEKMLIEQKEYYIMECIF